ncbi:MAG: trypsin-like peptidase domain-containing protein [Saprospiraceae bacterium]
MKYNQIAVTFFSAIIGAFFGVWVYTLIVGSPVVIFEQQKQKAILAAESEILLSERAEKVFRSSAPSNFIKATNLSRPAVVFIESASPANGSTYHTKKLNKTTGSGVLISNDGYIVTNNHVITGASNLQVTLSNNKEYKAKVIGFDEQTDLALLKIESTGLPYIIFGNSDSLQVGEWVLAVGNPFRLQSTVTAGIVSAKARNINILEQRGIESFIQTDAAVNPGNSGGALVNTNGELVGINTAILSSSGGYEGFSFAIPANLVKKIISDLKEYGAVQRGWMGVTIFNLNADLAKEIGLKDIKGVVVDALTKGGAAKESGLKKGDILLSINGTETNTTPQFTALIGQFSPGDILEVRYFRDGKTNSKKVILRNQLNTTDYIAVRKDKVLTDIGFELRDMDSNELTRNSEKGIYVVSVYSSSKARKANVEPGYIITSINNVKVSTVNGFIELLKDQQGSVVLNGYYENYPGEFPYTFLMD